MLASITNLFQNKENLHTLTKSFVALFIRIIAAFSALLFNLILTRNLGAQDSGLFFLSFSLVMLLAAISRMGFDNTVLRFTGIGRDNPENIRFVLQVAIKRILVASTIVSALAYIFAEPVSKIFFDKPDLTDVIRSMIFSIVGLGLIMPVAMSLQGRQKVKSSILAQGCGYFLICGTLIYLLQLSQAEVVARYLSISILFSFVFFFVYAYRNIGIKDRNRDMQKEDLLSSARKNSVTVFLNQLVQWTGPIVIGAFLLAEEVAYYSVAQRISMLSSFLLIAVNFVVAPKFAYFKDKGDYLGIKNTALFATRLLVVSTLPVLLIVLTLAPVLMGLFGNEFVQGYALLQVLILGQAVCVITGPVGFLLTMSGNENDMKNITIVSSSLILTLTPLLTNLYGAIGAAAATSFCIALQNLIAVYFVKKRLGFNTLKFWQKI